jgi:hypothetical protein
MRWEQIKLGLWSAIGGAVLLAIIGFSWGGWVTGGSAQEMAAETTSPGSLLLLLLPVAPGVRVQGTHKGGYRMGNGQYSSDEEIS